MKQTGLNLWGVTIVTALPLLFRVTASASVSGGQTLEQPFAIVRAADLEAIHALV
jgi:hypothetical protein